MKQLLEKHKCDLGRYEVKNIGTHSIRNNPTSYALIGSTASPSSVAIHDCGKLSCGTVRDIYILYVNARDHNAVQILAGPPEYSS